MWPSRSTIRRTPEREREREQRAPMRLHEPTKTPHHAQRPRLSRDLRRSPRPQSGTATNRRRLLVSLFRRPAASVSIRHWRTPHSPSCLLVRAVQLQHPLATNLERPSRDRQDVAGFQSVCEYERRRDERGRAGCSLTRDPEQPYVTRARDCVRKGSGKSRLLPSGRARTRGRQSRRFYARTGRVLVSL
ncbi:hypothetical protein BD309DRAFT_147495 [Dichomitus squalens]|nr:hypothetical protein BD309DRAFT_147495 [Dichomitus squalens]